MHKCKIVEMQFCIGDDSLKSPAAPFDIIKLTSILKENMREPPNEETFLLTLVSAVRKVSWHLTFSVS